MLTRTALNYEDSITINSDVDLDGIYFSHHDVDYLPPDAEH